MCAILLSSSPSHFVIPSFFRVAIGCSPSKKRNAQLISRFAIHAIKDIKDSFHSRRSWLGVGE
jgi:hypothetical protein